MKNCIIVIMVLSTFGLAENRNDNSCVNHYLFEISGLLNFETYGSNVYLNNSIEFGMNPLNNMNLALSASYVYRNYDSKLKTILSADYCISVDKLEIRAGCLGGLSSLYIGSYSNKNPLCGFEAILGVRVTPNVSIRLQHRSIWYFEDHTVYGSELLVGVTYSFFSSNMLAKRE